MDGPAIETENLTKYYGKALGVKDLAFEVRRGEVFGYLGPNGAGKTTTLRLLVGLLFPTSGNARVLGLDLLGDSLEIRRRIGYVSDEVRIFADLTGEESLDFLDSLRPEKRPFLKDELVDRFEIDLSRKVREYSSGNKQKLGIIQAVMHDPELLILDEPTSALDPLMRHRFYDLMRQQCSKGRTILLSSHVLPEMENICDRVGIIRGGRLVTVEEVSGLSQMKLRHAEFTLAADPGEEAVRFESAEVQRVDDLRFKADIRGEMDAFLKELSRLEVADLEVRHASLEEVFLQYYRDEEEGEGDGPA